MGTNGETYLRRFRSHEILDISHVRTALVFSLILGSFVTLQPPPDIFPKMPPAVEVPRLRKHVVHVPKFSVADESELLRC